MDADFVIPAATRLGHVHLTVANLERQIEFYRRVLGFELHWHEGKNAGLGANRGDLLRLTEDQHAQRPVGATGLYHFAVLFPERRELARALARLISINYPNYPTDHLLTETTYLDDSEGNGIELYVDTPERGSWSFSDGGFGATDSDGNPHSGREPLDVEGLLQELEPDDQLNQAAPEGTVVGHVHLHVSDIAEANRFYHELLGFEIQGISEAVGLSFVSAGGYHHHIGLNIWLGQGAPHPPTGALGLRYFEVLIPGEDELRRLTKRLDQAGVPIEALEGGMLVRDPSGHGVLLRKTSVD